jgi:hypothetical protein
MTILTQGARTAEFLISYDANRSFEKGVLAADLPVGSVVERATLAANTVATANTQNTGNGTVSAVSVLAAALPGTYTVVFTSATAFNVMNPSGTLVASGSTGTAFNTQINFTITAGATAFVAGDGFRIMVDVTRWQYAIWNAGTVFGVLYEGGLAGQERAVVARDAEVQISRVLIPAGKAIGTVISGLDARGIAARND